MADHADVMDLLEEIARGALFANGVSVTGKHITVGQGWPQSKDVDTAMGNGESIVSVYSEPSSTSATLTPINTTYVSKPPVAGTTVAYDDDLGTVSFGGVPVLGDSVFLSLGKDTYSYVVECDDTSTTVAAALLGMVAGAYLDATAKGGTLYLPSARKIYAAVSGVGEIATKIHSARTQYEIVVWAPTPSDRAQIARAIEIPIKDQVRWPLADTTSVLVTWQGTNLRDKEEKSGVFRRDIIVNATYETILVTPAQQVVGASIRGTA